MAQPSWHRYRRDGTDPVDAGPEGDLTMTAGHGAATGETLHDAGAATFGLIKGPVTDRGVKATKSACGTIA